MSNGPSVLHLFTTRLRDHHERGSRHIGRARGDKRTAAKEFFLIMPGWCTHELIVAMTTNTRPVRDQVI